MILKLLKYTFTNNGKVVYNWSVKSNDDKLADDQVRAIRSSKDTTAVLAERFNRSARTIRRIRSGESLQGRKMINPSEKPVVKYRASEGCLIRTNLDNKEFAVVFPVNHPDKYRVSNSKYVFTF